MPAENKFCVPMDEILSKVSDKACTDILEYIDKFPSKFRSYINVNGKTVRAPVDVKKGFSSWRLSDDPDALPFVLDLCNNENLNVNLNKAAIVVQRCITYVPPHTDPGKVTSLLYNIKGKATTNFYTTTNFIPDIDYKDTKLEKVFSIDMELKRWYLFNNRAIHEVVDIEGDVRVSLVINLHDLFKDLDETILRIQEIFI